MDDEQVSVPALLGYEMEPEMKTTKRKNRQVSVPALLGYEMEQSALQLLESGLRMFQCPLCWAMRWN